MKSVNRNPASSTADRSDSGAKWPRGGKHFIAYHNIERMGHDYDPHYPEELGFSANKPRSFLERSIGGAVWMVTGKKDTEGNRRYRLAAVFRPSEIRADTHLNHIVGTVGRHFDPPVELCSKAWFDELYKEQHHFSFGFNSIRGELVIDGLLAAWDGVVAGATGHLDQANALTVEDFQTAFEKIGPRLTVKQREMLQAHYNAPGRKVTARQLAAAVGYPNYNSANLQYGKIGSLLCDTLGWVEGSDALYVPAEFIPPCHESNKEWIWQMRDSAARTLEELGWVKTKEAVMPPAESDTPPDRIPTTINRIIRDTAEAKALKELYHFRCQICGLQIQPRLGTYYAEVHHVRPLGGDHGGPDDRSNMLVLCPNHHAMFDLWMPQFLSPEKISIAGEEFELEPKHRLSCEVVAYYHELRNKQLSASDL